MTRKTACIVAASIVACIGVLHLHAFHIYGIVVIDVSSNTTNVTTRECGYVNPGPYPVVSWMDMVVYALVPSVIIICSNTGIIVTLRRSGNLGSSQAAGNTEAQKSIHKIIPMLLMVSTTFVVSTIPLTIYYIGE